METDTDKALVYRQRAEHIRAVAECILSPDSRKTLLEVAADFDRLADTFEVGVLPPEIKSQDSK